MPDIRDARALFPATSKVAYFNTAAVSLASIRLAEAYRSFIDEWLEQGLDYTRGDAAGEADRSAVARLIGAEAEDIALIATVSAVAGLVAAQFGPARSGENVLVGEREYTSNQFPFRLLERKGFEVRAVPFRNGGVEPELVAERIDGGTRLVAFSAVQSATGHRTDLPAVAELAHAVGALVFVDGTQLVGALPLDGGLQDIDVLAFADHKFLLNAGRGIGYCYLSPRAQAEFTPVNAGWKAGRVPYESFFGPAMDLSPTASRFDSPIGWLAAVGDQAALAMFDHYGPDAVFARNRELEETLRAALIDVGWNPMETPVRNRSTIIAVPLDGKDPAPLLAELRSRSIVAAARDGNLRLSLHFYNHEDDIARVVDALAELGGPARSR